MTSSQKNPHSDKCQFDPEFRGTTAYRSKKRRVIPNGRHWMRGAGWNYWHKDQVTITFTEKQVESLLTRDELRRRAFAGH